MSPDAWATERSTRSGYDAVAEAYAEHIADELAGKPLDRALLALLAEDVGPGASVLDVGCGPGHVATYLAGLGLVPTGIDLSPGMIEVARRRYPDLDFQVASMLDLPDGQFAGGVAMYAIVHFDLDTLAAALEQIRGVLRPGAPLLLAFHVGDEVRHLEELFGTPVELDFVFFSVEDVRVRLERAGFAVESVTTRSPYPEVEVATERAYLYARAVTG